MTIKRRTHNSVLNACVAMEAISGRKPLLKIAV
jgi:hypothetical protein